MQIESRNLTVILTKTTRFICSTDKEKKKKSEECLSFDVYNNLTLFIVKYDHNPCQLKQRTRSQQQTHCNSRNITEMTKLNTTNTKPGEVNVSS